MLGFKAMYLCTQWQWSRYICQLWGRLWCIPHLIWQWGCLWSKFMHPSSLFTEVPNCQSSFGRAGSFYQNNHESKFRLCLLLSFSVSDVWIISLVESILCDPEPADLSSCWWKNSTQQHWNDGSRGSESISKHCSCSTRSAFLTSAAGRGSAQYELPLLGSCPAILLCMQFGSRGWTWSLASISAHKPVSHAVSAVTLTSH